MADVLTAIPAASTAFMAAHPDASVAQQAQVLDPSFGANNASVPAQGEPSVLSSRAGAQAFQTTVQPSIDAANAATSASAAKQLTAAQQAAALSVSTGDAIPQDVLDEIQSSKTPEDQALATQLTSWNQQIQAAKDQNASLTLSAKNTAAAQISALQSQWDERKALLEQSNSAAIAGWNQQFIRSGQAEYSPGMTGNLISGKEMEGQQKVKDLDNQYNVQIAAINAALEDKNYTLAADLTGKLNAIEDKATTVIAANAKAAADANQKIKDNLLQTNREMTISSLVKQGLTDPGDIQSYLNETNQNDAVGDMTIDDISKVLKIVDPSADLTGLNADYKTYKYLKDQSDPAVDGLDYYGYLKAVSLAQRKPDDGSGDSFKFSQTQQSQLLAGGFTSADVANMQADVAAHGIDAVIDGMTKDQQALVKRVLASSASVSDVVSPDQQQFTREYVSKLYGIQDTGTRPVGVYGGKTNSQKLDDIMKSIQGWYDAGYTDKDIAKALGVGI